MVIVIEGLTTALLFITDVGAGDMTELEITPTVSLGKGMDDGDWDEKDETVTFLGTFNTDKATVTEELPTIDVEENITLAFDGCCVGLLLKEASEDG